MENEESHPDEVLPSHHIQKLSNWEGQIEASPSDESTNNPTYGKCMLSIIQFQIYKLSAKTWKDSYDSRCNPPKKK
jgi:hypothetical protein